MARVLAGDQPRAHASSSKPSRCSSWRPRRRAIDGHINCSPKGLDTFRVIDDHTVMYLDLTGSGIETLAHLRDNGRITLMFCAFTGRPDIVRLYGRGHVVLADDPDAARCSRSFPSIPAPGR